mmetsp:Transcript_2906/g.6717  ORF Transcript_2906/g.6717 Transcript_2906/m.6717 type:complete len:281 (+) Transcript_2906:332-1174(+)
MVIAGTPPCCSRTWTRVTMCAAAPTTRRQAGSRRPSATYGASPTSRRATPQRLTPRPRPSAPPPTPGSALSLNCWTIAPADRDAGTTTSATGRPRRLPSARTTRHATTACLAPLTPAVLMASAPTRRSAAASSWPADPPRTSASGPRSRAPIRASYTRYAAVPMSKRTAGSRTPSAPARSGGMCGASPTARSDRVTVRRRTRRPTLSASPEGRGCAWLRRFEPIAHADRGAATIGSTCGRRTTTPKTDSSSSSSVCSAAVGFVGLALCIEIFDSGRLNCW